MAIYCIARSTAGGKTSCIGLIVVLCRNSQEVGYLLSNLAWLIQHVTTDILIGSVDTNHPVLRVPADDMLDTKADIIMRTRELHALIELTHDPLDQNSRLQS